MSLKFYNYEILVLKKLFEYCLKSKFSSFDEFMKYFFHIQRDINQSGEYLFLKHSNNENENNMELCNYTIVLESEDLKNGAEFIAWIGKNSILIEGYSFEDKWIKPNSKVIKIGVKKKT